LRPDRRAGRRATAGARPLAAGARRAVRDDAVRDRALRAPRPAAEARHAPADGAGARLRAARRAPPADESERGPEMRLRPDVEDIQTTRTEKLLAVVLAAFLLLGGVWTYQKLDDVVRRHEPLPTQQAGPASARLVRAQSQLAASERRRQQALQELELRREAYRTALEAHRPATALGRRWTRRSGTRFS